MFGLRLAQAFAALALAASAGSALAVGLGPLEKSGITSSERKGLYLTVSNPYRTAHNFRVFVEEDSGIAPGRVTIHPSTATIAPGAHRRILVIVDGLIPGEEVNFRLCAERIEERRVTVHARVCSKLGARRLRPAR